MTNFRRKQLLRRGRAYGGLIPVILSPARLLHKGCFLLHGETMAENKFTPGPWKSSGIIITSRNGSKLVSIACDKPNGAFPSELNRANATLIATAPELLEACEQALFFIDEGRDMFESYIEAEYMEKKVATRLRSAIAKARGES